MKDFLTTIIQDAGALALDYFYKGVSHTTKSHLQDLVTEADYGVSDFLVKKIQERYPEHSVTSEELEETVNGGHVYEWIIDPIDGTRNFAMGIPVWCIIVAILKNNEPYMGAVFAPVAKELFFAERGKGAFMNGKPIEVSKMDDLAYSIGHFSRMAESTKTYGVHIERYKHALDVLNHHTGVWIHQLGCMLGVCYLANGGFDFVVQNAGLDHDYAAPLLIAEEAGAKVTNSDGEPWQRGMQDIVVANSVMHAQLMEKLFGKTDAA